MRELNVNALQTAKGNAYSKDEFSWVANVGIKFAIGVEKSLGVERFWLWKQLRVAHYRAACARMRQPLDSSTAEGWKHGERNGSGALGDKVSLVHVVFRHRMRNAARYDRAPAIKLLEPRADVWERGLILECRQAVAPYDAVHLFLRFGPHVAEGI